MPRKLSGGFSIEYLINKLNELRNYLDDLKERFKKLRDELTIIKKDLLTRAAGGALSWSTSSLRL